MNYRTIMFGVFLTHSAAWTMDPKPFDALISFVENNEMGATIVHHTLEAYNIEISNISEYRRDNVRLENRFKRTGVSNIEAYKQSIENNTTTIITNLKELGFNFNMRNRRGQTPLALALEHRSLNIVIALFNGGADPNIPSNACYNKDITPLDIACYKKNNGKIIQYLLDKGASLYPLFIRVLPNGSFRIHEIFDTCLENAAVLTTHLKNSSSETQTELRQKILLATAQDDSEEIIDISEVDRPQADKPDKTEDFYKGKRYFNQLKTFFS